MKKDLGAGDVEKNDPPHHIESRLNPINNIPPTSAPNPTILGDLPMIGELAPLDKRVEAFNSELIPLLKKYHLELGAEPLIMQGMLFAKPIVRDYVPPTPPTPSV